MSSSLGAAWRRWCPRCLYAPMAKPHKYLCGLALCAATSCAGADLLPKELQKPVEKYMELRTLLDPSQEQWDVLQPLDTESLGLPTFQYDVEQPPEELRGMDISHYAKHYAASHPKVKQLRSTVSKYEKVDFRGGDATLDFERSLRFLWRGSGRLLTIHTNSSKPYKGVFTIDLGRVLKRSFGPDDGPQPPEMAE